MPIDFNQPPYFDDYYEENGPLDKGYYKVLFRPGVAVQTRELNQIQSMIQAQIEKFGSNIFREGSLVLGGQSDFQTDVRYVKLNVENAPSFDQINFNDFVGQIVEGQSFGLKAFILATEFDNVNNVQVLIVRYLNSALDNDQQNEITEFLPNENIVLNDDLILPVNDDANPTGNSSIFTINEGVIFVQGYFVQFPRQTIILEKYSSTPSKTIGFVIDEPLTIGSIQDQTLLDNAQGTFNFAAPGADRLVLSMKLVAIDNIENEDRTFSLIAIVKNGILEELKERSTYSQLYEEIAKRTFDESGDYYVRGLKVRTREALDTGNNEGLDVEGNPDEISVDVGPGLAYVKGFEINNISTKHVLIPKGNDTQFVNNSTISAQTGGYIVIEQILGLPSGGFDEIPEVELYEDSKIEAITQNRNLSFEPDPSKKIGTAKVKTVLYESGDLDSPTGEGKLRLYLFDIQIEEEGKRFSDTKSIYKEGEFFADTVLDANGKAVLQGNIENTLIYPVGTFNTKTIRKKDSLTQTDTNYEYYKTNLVSIGAGGDTLNVSSGTPDQFSYIGPFPRTLDPQEKKTIFISKESDGKYVIPESITINSANQIQIVFNNPFAQTEDLNISFIARRPEIKETPKILRKNLFIKGKYSETDLAIDDTLILGFSDVIRIQKVLIKYSEDEDFENENDGIDITDAFRLDKGQRDNFYDYAKLIPIDLNKIRGEESEEDPLEAFLLIKFDAYQATGHSYFSVDSYPVDDSAITDSTIFTYEIPKYISSSGTEFNLKDCFDFRPYKNPLFSYTTSLTNADFITNDLTNESFISPTLLIPVPLGKIRFDYSYYLPRRDVITLDKNGNFGSVQGTSSLSPITPSISENVMAIANIYIPPYPSISQSFARIIDWKDEFVTHQRVVNKRFTMREIGSLEKRIENLEYYNALSLLEKETFNLFLPNVAGDDRFKNGFFVDGFLDHSMGATNNPEYNIAIDKIEQVIRPVVKLDSFKYRRNDDTGDLSLLHLPFTETTLLNQNFASRTINVNQANYRFVGNLELTPDNDTWFDQFTVDRDFEFGNNLSSSQIISTEWGSWERYHVGYDISRQTPVWTGLKFVSGQKSATTQHLGAFTSYAASIAASRAQSIENSRGNIESLSDENRSGIQTSVTFDKSTQNTGNFVIDTSVGLYIQPQSIEFFARGLKPNTRHNVSFDDERLPLDKVRQFEDNDRSKPFTSSGSFIRSSSSGEIRGVIFLHKPFTLGTKTVRVFSNDENSVCETIFIASGINQQKQNNILSTKNSEIINQEQEFQARSRNVANIVSQQVGSASIGYVFRVDGIPLTEEGIFLTSVDLFIDRIDNDGLGFKIELREVNSFGNITNNVLPYSKVWLEGGSENIERSSDATKPFNIKFPSPVFLYNETQYAIVISPENANPNTLFWISTLNQTDRITRRRIETRQTLTGALYISNNGINWDLVPQSDLKLRLNRASFSTNSVLETKIVNDKYEFFNLENISNNFNFIGETIIGSQELVISLTEGNILPSVGNIIKLSPGGEIKGKVIRIEGNNRIFTDSFELNVNNTIEFFDDQTDDLTSEAIINNIFQGKAKLRRYSSIDRTMQLFESNGRFFKDSTIKGEIEGFTAKIESFGSFKFNSSIIKPDFINFNNTSIAFDKRGRNSLTNSFITEQDGAVDNTSSFPEELHILSHSEERRLFTAGNRYSSDVTIQISSESEFLSPIVDISRAHSIYIYNDIKDNPNKYISKTVTLADGQDASDLVVFLSSYRPPETEVKVYMKVRNVEDPDLFDEKEWEEMIKVSPDLFSSSSNEFDFIQMKFQPDPSILNNEGIVTAGGEDFIGFRQFAIKIEISSTSSSIVPKVADLRAIALQL